MRRALVMGFALACGCATTLPSDRRELREASAETVARCHLVGSLSESFSYDPRNPVLDETKSMGPTKVIWLNPPTTTLIRTAEGLVYRCDATL